MVSNTRTPPSSCRVGGRPAPAARICRGSTLASHEFFHAWNVKRLRPIELGPFNYESENETRSLWIAEGITDYYGALNLQRAGISTREELLDSIFEQHRGVADHTWTARPVGGAGLVRRVDQVLPAGRELAQHRDQLLHQRRRARDSCSTRRSARQPTVRRSLDDVMRTAYQRFAGTRGYTPADFRGVVEEIAGTSLKAILGSCD